MTESTPTKKGQKTWWRIIILTFLVGLVSFLIFGIWFALFGVISFNN